MCTVVIKYYIQNNIMIYHSYELFISELITYDTRATRLTIIYQAVIIIHKLAYCTTIYLYPSATK